MASQNLVNWEHGEHNSLVSIGTHNIHLTVTGPDRKPTDPIIIILYGHAASAAEWVVVRDLLSTSHRVVLYDRSGIGLSEDSPNPPTAETIAAELYASLKATDIKPPYLLIGHSWGGITSREFMHLSKPGDIKGVVLVDANSEESTEYLVNPVIWECLEGIDYLEVCGLNQFHALNDEQWKAYRDEGASEKHQKTAAAESRCYGDSGKILAAKKQLEMKPPLLGNAPMSLVLPGTEKNDVLRMFDVALKERKGTDEKRQVAKKWLEKWSGEQPRLEEMNLGISAGEKRVVRALKSGHNVQLQEPEVIVGEVEWVLKNIK